MKTVMVESIGQLKQEIRIGPHRIQADEPVDAGGEGTGPDPYELLLSALGACTSMTLLLYSRQKHWPLSGVKVTLRHEKIHGQDCAECETKSGMLDHIERDIALEGELSTEQRERLLEIDSRLT
jgi:putative redox protein